MTTSRTFRPAVQRGATAARFSGADTTGPARYAVPRRLSQRSVGAQIASGAGGRFALAGAKCERRLPARYGPAPEVLIDGPNDFARQRVFPSREGGSDVLTEVRSGDAVLVPDETREWRICFHPAHTEGYR